MHPEGSVQGVSSTNHQRHLMSSEFSQNSSPSGLLGMIAQLQDVEQYRELNWEGNFEDYLALVKNEPGVARNSYQRLYDLILHFGTEEYTESRKRIVRYNFFGDPIDKGRDAVFGIDVQLMKLVNVLKRGRLK